MDEGRDISASEKRVPAKHKRKKVVIGNSTFSSAIQKVTNIKPARNLKNCTTYNGTSLGKVPPNNKSNEVEWIDTMEECPVYHPSKEEFEDPLVYLQKIAPEASKFGICKVVSPLCSSTPAGDVLMKEQKGFKFTTKLQPLRLVEWDKKEKITFFMRGRKYTIRDFEIMANKAAARRYCISGCLPSAYVEKDFWREMLHAKKGMVEYGIDIDGTAFSRIVTDPLAGSRWNLKILPRLPGSTLRLLEKEIPGITEPMLYIGMLFSMFAWHVEDHYLYSINYHHCGAPKTWYGVPGHAAQEFESVAQRHVYNEEVQSMSAENGIFNALLDKTTMFCPNILRQCDVPVYKAVQMPGEFVITFPRAYHSGFSHGFNCCEAVNFATGEWFPFGAAAGKRYAILCRMPIIPFEKLLCAEAMLLSKSSIHKPYSSAHLVSLRCVKTSFSCLLRSYHCARWCLKKFRTSLRICSTSQGYAICFLCKRECYVAHIECKCYAGPICLFHDETFNCPCGSSCCLFVREDISEMEAVAKMFEAEEGIRSEVEQIMKSEPYLGMQTATSHVKGRYIPYCEILPANEQNDEATMPSMQRCSSNKKKRRVKKEDGIFLSINTITALDCLGG